MGMNFVAIDFETANFTRASACAVGLARVKDGEVDAVTEWHIDPPGGRLFTNSYIHGISERDVVGAPDWLQTLDRIVEFAAGAPLIAYSGFDRGVHDAASSHYGVAGIGSGFRNIHSAARRVLAEEATHLPDLKLPTVARHLGVDAFDHHSASADARACAEVALRLATRIGATEIDDLAPYLRSRSSRSGAYRNGPLPIADLSADPAHPLYGQTVCFSGKAPGYDKKHLADAAAALGATVVANSTNAVTLLVMGEYTPESLRPGAKVGDKAQRAYDRAAQGHPVEVIDSVAFLQLVALTPGEY